MIFKPGFAANSSPTKFSDQISVMLGYGMKSVQVYADWLKFCCVLSLVQHHGKEPSWKFRASCDKTIA